MKFSLKRMLSFILALGMLFAMVPELGIEADAATTISDVSVTGLEATYDKTTNNTTLGTDGKAECKGSPNAITVTANSSKNLFGGITVSTVTIYLKNTTYDYATLSFHYEFANGGSLSNALTATTAGSGDKNVVLAKDESITILLTTSSSGTTQASLKLTNIQLTEAQIVKTTFLPADDATMGSYTVDGQRITAQTELEKDTTLAYTVVAAPASGYQFVGWYDQTNGKYISYNSTDNLLITQTVTIKPVFTVASNAIFDVDGMRFDDLTEAVNYATANSKTQIILVGDGTVSGSHMIPAGITLLIPFNDANTCYTTKPGDAGVGTAPNNNNYSKPTAYRTLTMAEGAKITVNGAISVSANHTLAMGSMVNNGAPTGPCGFIRMNSGSNITVESGGTLYAWGFITGPADSTGNTVINSNGTVGGTVTVNKGGKVYEYFQVSEFRGGSALSDYIGNIDILPFSQYYVQNVEVPMTLQAGATENVYFTAYMQNERFPVSMEFIGSGGLFNMSRGTTTKAYYPQSDRLVFDINGDMSLGSIVIQLRYLLTSMKINSADYLLPINSNITINLHSEGNIYMSNDAVLLPGAVVNIAEGATAEIAEDKCLILFDRDEWVLNDPYFAFPNAHLHPVAYSPSKTGSRGDSSLVDAKIDLNGTLNIKGALYTTTSGASIISSNDTGVVIFDGVDAPADTTFTCSNQKDKVPNPTAVNATAAKLQNADTTYEQTSGSKDGEAFVCRDGKWVKLQAVVSFDKNNKNVSGEIADVTLAGKDLLTGYSYTLPDETGFTSENYEFVEWNTQADGEGDAYAVGATAAIKGDTTFYAQWKGVENTITFMEADGSTQLLEKKAEYGSTIELKTEEPTKTGCNFIGWAKTSNAETADYAAGAAIPVQGDATLYAVWEVQKCTITWVNDDGSNLASVQVENGNAFPAYPKDTEPAKAGDAKYSYEFAGWDMNNDKKVDTLPETVTGDVTLKAVYTPVVNKYTVTWKDWNGTEIDSKTVEYGTYLASLQPANPSRPEDAAATYGFAGWDADGNGTAEDTLPDTVTGDVTYTATYTAYKKSYTITWVVNGEPTTRSVEHGAIPVYPDAEPSKAADAQYTYTFAGWDADGDEDVDVQPDGAFPAVSGAATYTAVFDKTVNQYTITWKDGDGNLLKEEKLDYGATPKYEGDPPTKTSDGQYSYEWDGGWSPVIASVTKDADYQATFEKTTRTYTVIWQNEDGTELEKDTGVEYGADPSYDGAEPAKEGNAQFTYTFAGWDPAVEAVKGDVTYKATYTPETNKYTVTWKDWDGTVLETDENVPFGTRPTYDGATPTKAADAQYTYTWTGGWTTEVETVKGDVVYTAAYNSVVNKYTIKFVNEGGAELQSSEVAFGDTPAYTGEKPTKAATAQYSYEFAGWTPEIAKVTGEATYTATYTSETNKYTVTFKNGDVILQTGKVDYGHVPTYGGTTPVKAGDAQYTYEFAGWDKEIVAVDGEVTYNATFNSILNQYTVIWQNEDGTELEKDEDVDYGTTPSYDGAVPTKAATAEYTYTFDKWNPTVSEVTGDVTYTATYSQKANEYTVTYYSDPDKVYDTFEVAFGEDFPTVEAPSKEGYTFTGWVDAQGNEAQIPETMPAQDVSIYAKWTVNTYTITYMIDKDTVYKTITAEFGESITAPENPTRDGYSFKAWDAMTPSTMPARNTEINAIWTVVSYTIGYDLAGGSLAEGQSNPASYTVESEAIKLVNPTREGYSFAGWTGTGLENPTMEVTVTKGSTGNRSYEATWTPIEYTIDFDSNGGNEVADITAGYETAITAPVNPTKTGYTFAGWYVGEDKVDVPAAMPLGGLTLTAKWEAISYKISYFGAAGVNNPGSYTIESEDITLNNPSKEGYTFIGWTGTGLSEATKDVTVTKGSTGERIYTANWEAIKYAISYEDAAGVTNPDSYTIESEAITLNNPSKEGYTFTGWTGTGLGEATMNVTVAQGSTGDRTYKANWKAIDYTIGLDSNGDGEADDVITQGYETSVEKPADPAKDGYEFQGWYNGENAVQWPMKMPLNGVTLTAKWDAISYTITYEDAAGVTNPVSYNVETEDFTLQNPSKEGYTFMGWSGTGITGTAQTVTVVNGSTGNRTYTANWEAIEYTITYEDAAGVTNPDNYTIESEAITLNNPSKEGYTFMGWTGTDLGEATMNVTVAQGSIGNRSYKANWKAIEYTIGLDNDGDGVADSEITQGYETSVAKPADPAKDGYEFQGWYNGENAVQWPMKMPLNGVTLTAKWDAISYTITYEDAAGVTNPTSYNVESESFTLNNPSKEGYTFIGWTGTDLNEATMDVTVAKGSIGNRTYTANWAVNQYTITFYLDAAETEVHYSAEVNYGAATPTPATPANKDGFRFAGWEAYPSVMPAESVSVHAVWAENQYAITYNANAGTDAVSGSMPTQMVDIEAQGDTLAKLNTNAFVRTGYTFAGWNTAADGTGDSYADQAENVKLEKDLVLYAVWDANEYTITFANTGDTTVDPITAGYREAVTAPSAPEKKGYTFAGWYVGEDKVGVPAAMPLGGLTLTAKWEVISYKISYFGAAGVANPDSYTVDSDDITLTNPSKEGYTFMGWTGTGLSEATKDVTVTKGSTGERIYTANWQAIEYTIIYKDAAGVANPDSYTIESEDITLNNPSKEGYTFMGWSGTGINGTAQTVTVVKGSTGERTYTANWQAIEYTITYEDAAGVTNPGSYTIESEDITLNNPTREGYTFMGWSGTGITGTAQTVTVTKGSTGNRSYTATWSADTYTISYNLVGGSLAEGEENSTSYTIESDSFSLINPTKTGYTFAGWTGTGLENPTMEVTVTKGSTGNRSYTATWTINQYTVNFNAKGGQCDVAFAKQDYNTIMSAPAASLEGHTFSGWALTDGGTVAYKAGESITFNVTNDRTLYAVWSVNKYTVEFVVDGEVFDSREITYGENITAPATDPSKTGHTFAGWYDADDEKVVFPVTMPADGLTLTAKWDVNTYEIIFNTDGGSRVETITAKYGAVITEEMRPADPTKTGYKFEGWDKEIPETMPAGGMLITAKWTVKKYTISFVDTGDVAMESIELDYGADVPTITNPTKTGHEFKGWDKTIPATMPAENITLTATWDVNEYIIYFYDGAERIDYKLVKYGEAITAPTGLSKEGHTFTGWSPEVPVTMPAYDLTVYAQWDANAYTITFDTDGGTAIEPATYDYGETVTAPAAPTKEGYTFTGWSPALPKTMPAKDYEVTAQWKINQYTITFNTDGGTAVAPITQDYNTEVTAPADPTKVGYTFDGWSESVPGTMPAENKTITAKWTINQYTITFNTDGGTAVVPITQDYNTAVTAPAAPTKTGYTFDGWSESVPGTMPAENKTITAKWKINQYTISFNSDGGSRVTSITQDYNTAVTAPAAPTKTGYTFVGWEPGLPETMPAQNTDVKAVWQINEYTITFDTDGGSAMDAITQQYNTDVTKPANPTKTGYTFAGWLDENGEAANVPAKMPARNVTLKAKWNINTYTITFNTDGGSVIAPITQQYGTDITAPAAPAKAGYTFAGWDVEIPATMPAGNLIITAKWTVNQYTITFNTDGGSEIAAITQDYGTAIVAPADPTKTGYTFAGWDVDIPENMPANDLTVTAKWTINQYKITFATVGGTAIDPIVQDYGTPVTAPADPVKEGYTFTGWAKDIPETMPAENIVIMATWSINSYTITFADSNVEPITAEYGAEIIAPANPVKEGYTFLGWDKTVPATMPAGDMTITAQWRVDQHTITFADCGLNPINASYGTVIDKPADPVRTGYTFLGWDVAIPETMPAKDMTITALWQINQYTITFDTDGGTAIDPITQDYNTAVTEPADPEKIGYTFVGWDKDIPLTMPAEDQTITAKWTINQYTVTFDTDGGSAVESVAKNYGEQIEEPAAPEKEGHSFTGWVDVEGNAVSFPVTVGAQDVTIKAIWKANQYTITFNTDGGNEIASITQDYGTVITAPANPTKEGYSFAGWNVKIPETMPAGDMTITAKWNINRYTITFTDTGDTVITDISRPYGAEIIAPSEPVKEGYTFLGWDQEIPATMPAGGMTIAGQWKVNQYTISFKECGYESITADYGTPLNIEDPTREGYSFDGWNDVVPATMPAQDMELTARWVINQYTITFNTAGGDELDPITQDYGTPINFNTSPEREGYTFITWSPELPKTMPAQDMTLTAIWTLDTYTITFDTAGGSAMAPIVQQYGTEIVAPENPTREGYIFDGWDIKIPETMPAENLTITASWKPATFTITFVSDGEEVGSVTAEYGSAIRPVNPPSKTGYDFAGWEPAIPATMPSEDLVVTAKWTPQKYTLYFDANGGEEIPLMTMDYGAKIEVPADPVREGYIFTGWDMEIPETMPAEDLVIVASWKIGSFAITFDTDGGSEVGEIVQNYGTPVRVPEDPTRTGYTFVGWEPEIPETMPGKDMTIKAIWKAKQYTLSFNTEGGSEIEPITADYGSPITAPKAPKKAGYTFVGWDKKIPETMPARNMIFNAIWEEGEEPADLFYISFANMTLGNSLKMNFAFEQGHLEDWTGHYATIRKTYADGRPDVVVTIPYAQWEQADIGNKAYHVISFNGIAAKEMADDVFVTVFNAEGEPVSYVWEDSVRDYAMRTLNNPYSSEETLIMIVDALNYGAAAQSFFKYNVEDPANNQLTDEQVALATPSVTFADSRTYGENYLGTLLSLDCQILMRLAFDNVTEDMYAVISFTSHSGKSYEVTVQSDAFEFTGDVAVINVDEIVVADGRMPVTVTVYNADGTVHSTVTDSMESYIARMSESDAIYEMIMKFSDSAYNYFHKDDV